MVDTVQGTLITPGTTLNLSNLTLQGGLVTSNVSLTTGTIVQTGMYTPDGTNLVLVSNSAQQINIAPSGVLSSLSNIQTTASLVAANLVGNGTITGAMVTVGNVAVNAGVPPTNGMYLPAANTLALASGSTQRLTISPTGNVGIGSSTPAYTMDVAGNVRSTGTMVMASPFTMRNKIINGAMVIDQRNAGAAVTSDNYTVDRWIRYFNTGTVSVQQSAIAPPGFSNSLGVTITVGGNRNSTSYAILQQNIEGYNIADLAMGTSSAKSVTLSFWVRSSLTGLFSGAMTASDNQSLYVFTYTISAANTWQFVTATIPGYTSGVWATNNGTGTLIRFDLGSGSNYQASASGSWVVGTNQSSIAGTVGLAQTTGATFYVTGVQLEIGSVATPFELRNYQQELAMCQRYYFTSYIPVTSAPSVGTVAGISYATNGINVRLSSPVPMRTSPSSTVIYNNSTQNQVRRTDTGGTVAVTINGYSNWGQNGWAYVSFSGTPVLANLSYDFDYALNSEL